MKRYRLLIVSATAVVVGIIGGIVCTQYCLLLDAFPRAIALRFVISDNLIGMPPKAVLPLLDIYESEVRHQLRWFGTTRFDWSQELTSIALQRYVVYARDNQPDLAEKALNRAATLRRHGTPTKEDLEFERQLANRLFAADGANAKPH